MFRSLFFAAPFLFMIATPANAQGYGSADWGISSSTLSDMIQVDMLNRSLGALQDATGISDHGSASKTKSKATPVPKKNPLDVAWSLSVSGKYFSNETGVNRLARMFPADEFQERKDFFTESIIQYGNAMPNYGLPKLNLATSSTMLVAGAYQAYTGKALSTAQLQMLYRQLDTKLRNDPNVINSSLSEKAGSYQFNMGMGLLLKAFAGNADAQKDPESKAWLTRTGGAALQSIFGVSPDRIQFTNAGLVIK